MMLWLVTTHMAQIELVPHLTLYAKIKSRWIKDLDVKKRKKYVKNHGQMSLWHADMERLVKMWKSQIKNICVFDFLKN